MVHATSCHSRLFNRPAATGEGALLRQFKHGRTEIIRCCTIASLAFMRIMSDPKASVSGQHQLYHGPWPKLHDFIAGKYSATYCILDFTNTSKPFIQYYSLNCRKLFYQNHYISIKFFTEIRFCKHLQIINSYKFSTTKT